MGRIRIVGAQVVTPEGVKPAEVTIDTDTGKIISVDDGWQGCDILSYVPAEPIDASGMWLVPGGIDPHVHFGGFGDIPIADDFWTGSLGALAGGTTTVMDFCEPTVEEDARAVIARRMADASRSAVDYAFHFVLSEQYRDLLQDLAFIEDECGIRDYKLFTVYGNTTLSLDNVREIFSRLAGDPRRTFLIHAEDADLVACLEDELGDSADMRLLAATRPDAVEFREVEALHELVGETGVRACIAHSTCAETVALLDEPLARGEFELETCPHYLAFTSEKLAGPGGARYTMVPPLRTEADQEALWDAILAGKLKFLSTDHCPYHVRYKDGATYQSIPNGVDGVQWRMLYAFSEGVAKRGLSMPSFVDLTSANAARFYGMWPRKGCIAAGADADLVLIDPRGTTVLGMGECASAINYSIYEGMELSGRIARVFKGGREVYDGKRVCAEPGSGRFLAR